MDVHCAQSSKTAKRAPCSYATYVTYPLAEVSQVADTIVKAEKYSAGTSPKWCKVLIMLLVLIQHF